MLVRDQISLDVHDGKELYRVFKIVSDLASDGAVKLTVHHKAIHPTPVQVAYRPYAMFNSNGVPISTPRQGTQMTAT
ncbi:hypothetical protein Vi05172_g11806 [Venturia inaequalis]|nr:hypothetical protein Vi05172_g11806 [Venturia inaequalis]